MDYKQAHEILKKRLNWEHNVFTAKKLHDLGWYLSAEAETQIATLDGDFNADELEAIALWLRNPEGVINGGNND